MSSLNAKSRANFNEWLENIADGDLEFFVFDSNTDKNTDEVDFGSSDFKLVHSGVSNGEPVDCHMIEARVHSKTKDKQLKKLCRTSGSMAKDPTRLAFVLVPTGMNGHCKGQHVRQALRESPVEGVSIVNKVHLQWDPAVKLESGRPVPPRFGVPNVVAFLYEKIPFQGYRVDGTKKGKGKKLARRSGETGMLPSWGVMVGG